MIHIEHSLKLNIPVRNAYRHLTDFESYPRFVESVREVLRIDDMRLQWRTETEDGVKEWEIELTELSPEKCIAWRNLDGPVGVGSLVLDPTAPDETMVTLMLGYHPGADETQSGEVRRRLSRQMQRDLACFKEFVESKAERGTQPSEERVSGQHAPAQAEIDETPPTPRIGKTRNTSGKPKAPRAGSPRTGSAATNAKPSSVPGDAGNWAPPVEIAHGEKEVIVCAELPGVKREDIRIEIRGEKLTIEGERSLLRSMQEMEYRRSERPYGHFSRLIVLPDGIDARAAAASLQDGVLEIRVPMTARAGTEAFVAPPSSSMTELVGWISTFILAATISRQVYTQWKTRSVQGVSRWLFIGQLAASVGFVIYSALVKNWVFVCSNVYILLTAVAGQWIYMRNSRRAENGDGRQ